MGSLSAAGAANAESGTQATMAASNELRVVNFFMRAQDYRIAPRLLIIYARPGNYLKVMLKQR